MLIKFDNTLFNPKVLYVSNIVYLDKLKKDTGSDIERPILSVSEAQVKQTTKQIGIVSENRFQCLDTTSFIWIEGSMKLEKKMINI